ncbi:MAG: TonB-dependent receptor [Pseudomonadota bacterium]
MTRSIWIAAFTTTCLLALGETAAVAQDELTFDIPSQPLAQAVAALGGQTGLQIGVTRALAGDRVSTSVSGTMTPRDALRTMLAGTGLTFESLGPDGVRLFEVSTGGDGPVLLDEIVIQGEIVDRTLEESATSAVVIRGEELERSGGDIDIQDALDRTPGIVTNGGNEGFTIRGINNRGTNTAGGQTINTQIDGVSLPNFRLAGHSAFSNWDLEQLEILRGPQSTQQGRGALAGAVIVRSKDPIFEPEFKLRGELGNFETRRASTAINIPIIDDTFALRFSADILESDGFIDNLTQSEPSNPTSLRTFRGKARFRPTDDLDMVLSLTYAENFTGGDGDFADAAAFPDRFINFSNRGNREGSEQFIYGLRVGYDINDALRLESETTYLDADSDRILDFDGTAVDVPFAVSNSPFLRDNPFETEVFEQDLTLSFQTERTIGKVGVFYTEIDDLRLAGESFDFSGVLPALPGVEVIQVAGGDTDLFTRNIAVYGETDIFVDELVPGLSFTVGARYDYEEFENRTNVIFDPGFPQFVIDAFPEVADTETTASGSFGAFLPKAGVNFDITDTQRVSFTFQRGYRAGGAVSNTASVTPFDPEFTNNFELAYRGTFFDDRLRIRGNAFYTRFSDQQVSVAGADPGTTIVENAGSSEVYGGELTIQGDLTDRLLLTGSLAASRTRFIEFQSGATDLSGNEFANAPLLTAYVAAEYEVFEGLSLGLAGRYESARFADAQNTPETEGDNFFVADAQVLYEVSPDLEGIGGVDFSIGAFVNNIFDNDYAIIRADGDAIGSTATTSVLPGSPRSFGIFVQSTF